jgi:ATP-dependent Lhr-like helicase
VHLLYVSPLKALSNDIRVNLEGPLAALRERFAAAGEPFPELRVAVRTGDTPQRERRAMRRRAPHILVTTPESLHLLLTTPQQQGLFSALQGVIVDEVHALAGTKRGAHLALTLERLVGLVGRDVQRIGLSATVRPPETVARWLGGAAPDGTPRPVTVVDCGTRRPTELVIRSPVPDLAHVDGTVWPDVYRLVLGAIRSGRTTLVFVNHRGLAERLAAQVNALAHEVVAHPYHGSLDRERRLTLEQALKAGTVRALVTTSALELGIDVGAVDQVVQVQSPGRASAALQRLGRAGHRLGEVSRAIFVPTHLADALDCIAVVEAARAGDVEPLAVPTNALDVLAQVLVATTATTPTTADALFALARRAWPYRDLPRSAFDETLGMLAGAYPADVAAELAPRLAWDRATGAVTPLPGSRLAAVLNGGTIPDRGLYRAVLAEGGVLGELDEEFVFESRVGDAFRLGTGTWRIVAIEHDRVIVQPAPGAAARLPFWHGEYAARAAHLAPRLGAVRRALGDARDDAARDALAERWGADRATIDALANWIARQREACGGIVPDDRDLVLEQHRDETGALRLVLHAPFGARVTAPWGLALAERLRERTGATVIPMALDDGLLLRLPDLPGDSPTAPVTGLVADEAERLVLGAVGGTALFGARFRMNAQRALVLPRSSPGRRVPLWLQRLKAADLLESVRREPSFPLVVETYRDVLQDAFDLPALAAVLRDLAAGTRRLHVRRLAQPSPFASAYAFRFTADWMYGDDAPRPIAHGSDVLGLDRALLDEVLGRPGHEAGFEAALARFLDARRGTCPGRQARTVDELAALLDRAGDLTPDELVARTAPVGARRGDPVSELFATGRAVLLPVPTAEGPAWRAVLSDHVPRYVAAFGPAIVARVRAAPNGAEEPGERRLPAALRAGVLARPVARREIVVRWLALAGPVSRDAIRARYDVPDAWLDDLLQQRTRAGWLLRVPDPHDREAVRWCARRPLEAAWRRLLAERRRDVTAVPLARYAEVLAAHHGLGGGTPNARREATDAVLARLSGARIATAALVRDVLPARFAPSDLAALSGAFASGRVAWVGAPPAGEPPTTLTAVRLVPRGAARAWLPAPPPMPDDADVRAVHAALVTNGASFLDELVTATGLTVEAVQQALVRLASVGLVTNDTRDVLDTLASWRPPAASPRTPLDAAARWGADGMPVVQRRGRPARRWRRPDVEASRLGWTGRWSLVDRPALLGPELPAHDAAEGVARTLLLRYGVVSRDWWRRDRPAVAWRDVYRALVRLEFRGDALRGRFVQGLLGVQFARPDVVDALQAPEGGDDAQCVVLAAADPANVYALPLEGRTRTACERPRGPGGVLVLHRGAAVASAEHRGAQLHVADDAPADVRTAALRALGEWLAAHPATPRRLRDVECRRVNGEEPTRSPHLAALRAAGWRVGGRVLRFPVRLA